MAERQSLTFGSFRRNLPQSRLWREAQPMTLREGALDGPHQSAQPGSRTVPCSVARGSVECTRTTDAARARRAECVTAYLRVLHSHEEEYRVLPFIHEGFARGEKAFHIVDPAT